MKIRISNQGFTITEFLVTIAVSGIVMSAIYSSFYSQQKSYLTQEQIAAMQQNLRAAMYVMEREVRMAGYDPTADAGAGIHTAGTSSIRLTKDITNDAGTGGPDGDIADANEDITYALFDADGDGDNDLGRNDVNGSGNLPVAENIDALNFVYLDENRTPTTTLSEMRSVQITILARAGQPDRGYSYGSDYQNQQGQTIYTPPAGDHYRRKLLTAEVKCRNLGIW
jgi:type IV pilus assembly protein PilW